VKNFGGKVEVGFEMLPLKGPNLFKPDEWVDAFPSVKSEGVITYKTKRTNRDGGPDNNPPPVKVPVHEKEPWCKKASDGWESWKDWYHDNVTNHDWSESPWDYGGSDTSPLLSGLSSPLLSY
jgi:hypothetical protein